METQGMTALMSAFARAHHAQREGVKVLDDSMARHLLGADYERIAHHLRQGAEFFYPGAPDDSETLLRRIVDERLSPAPLGRAAFAEASLRRAAAIGAMQYIILGAGLDSFALRQPEWARSLEIFELDLPAASEEKRCRIAQANLTPPQNLHQLPADLSLPGWSRCLLNCKRFQRGRIGFCSLLGVSYYLPCSSLADLIAELAGLLQPGSALVLDYASERPQDGRAELAAAAGEPMRAAYACDEMTQLLADRGFLIYEHLTPGEMTAQYFSDYNRAHPSQPLRAQSGTNYALAVRH